MSTQDQWPRATPPRIYLAPPSRDHQMPHVNHLRDQANSGESGDVIALIAQALLALALISTLIWGIGQATAAQDRALFAISQVQP